MPGLSEFSSGYGLDESLTKSGKRKAKAEDQQLDIGQQQLDIARELYDVSGKARTHGADALGSFLETGALPVAYGDLPQQSAPRLQDFLNTGQLPTALQPGALPPVVRPGTLPSVADTTAYDRDVLEQQFGRARENTLSQAPALGGGLGADLTNLEGARALGATQIYSAQKQREFDQQMKQYALNYGADVSQQQQDVGAIQDQGNLARSLYGAGLNYEAQDVAAQRQQRQQLFAQALGVGFQDSGLALSGLAGSSNTYGNVASLALKESLEKQKAAQDKAATIGSFGIGGAGGAK